ncbi:glycosyltransferase [Mycobacterium sp. ST-F2]|uniref:glycosyltransferase n=1 Tax=Mycobacterium sp. ST-F2 TaxID=1490484 RepID=UPI00093B1A27|nr:glycosyltransferase [Mycobacterium sp. ST-F2]OKH83274.1 glycosyltransferase [Mycobacterium sp. ST-F2]
MAGVVPRPKFDHLLAMTDQHGTCERACGAEPRPEHGYCTDDMARVLVVASREPDADDDVHGLARVAVKFLDSAQSFSGGCRNRLERNGHWTDDFTFEACWGRCLWGLGTAAAHSDVGLVRSLSVVQFERAARGRSACPRAMAFAAVGAAELLSVEPGHMAARRLIDDYAAGVAAWSSDADWPWPEARLTSANALLPEAMIAAGDARADSALCKRGLDLLEWLIDCETVDGHLSVCPAGGWAAGEPRPGFAQRPVEVAALADACARAAGVDASAIWPSTVRLAASWFQGANDARTPMWDPATGGGFDGLRVDGVDRNQGAESTLAVLSTFQQAHRLVAVTQ